MRFFLNNLIYQKIRLIRLDRVILLFATKVVNMIRFAICIKTLFPINNLSRKNANKQHQPYSPYFQILEIKNNILSYTKKKIYINSIICKNIRAI
jgi:hypothetical protein